MHFARVPIYLLLMLAILGCGSHKPAPSEHKAEAESDREITPGMIQEYAMIHQMSDLKTAEYYLKHPEYARENPYRPSLEDMAFYERAFLEWAYPNYEKVEEKRGFVHTRGLYRGINPHDDNVTRSWKRKYRVSAELKKTSVIENELAEAERLYRAGKLDEAIEHARLAMQADPESPSLLYDLGVIYLNNADYPEAMQCFRRSLDQLRSTGYTNINIAMHPKVYLGVLTNLGLVYTNLGAHDEAVKVLQEAIQFEPEDLDANWNLGVAYWSMGDMEKACAQIRKYIALDPNNPESHNIIGLIYYRDKLYDAALDEFQIAARLAPDFDQYNYNVGVALARLGRYEEATKAFKRASGMKAAEYMHRIFAEQLAANNVRKLYNDGCAAMESFNSTKAIELFEAALELEPDMMEAHVNLGVLYGQRGDKTNQIRHLEEAVRLDPDVPCMRYNLGSAYYDARMYSKATTEFKKAIERDASHRDARFKLGMILCKARSYADAGKEFEACLELSPKWFEPRLNLGTCYLKTGNADGAIEQFEEAIRLRPRSAEAYYGLGEAYVRKKEYDAACTFFQKTLDINPGYKQAQTRLEELKTYQSK